MDEQVTLPPVADLTEAGPLKDRFLQAISSGTSLTVDASAVQRVSSPCLQVLVAGKQSFAKAGGASLTITDPSEAFRETASVLGLLDALELGK
ncbi:anti-anti-sigma regulatory factor [Rhizomicrobium palustre]|uniref:Anti-anti-sigma regulatory factor n=1 Tax=Rhizomicrobium palustre TaxID=189966 RepID=A0A846MZY8_9PROT|nr:STAS domain-containing protein [Rhizomicrobium palustre]NIK89234.1 anti-anti-sigma regulatory factor [Rhizomicrobium palustre]